MNDDTHSSEPLDVDRKTEMFESYITRLRQIYSQRQDDPLLPTIFLSNLERVVFNWESRKPTKPKDPPLSPLDYKRARKIRTKAGLNITQLVIQLGHPEAQSYISRYERGLVNPLGSNKPVATKYLAWLSEHGYKKA